MRAAAWLVGLAWLVAPVEPRGEPVAAWSGRGVDGCSVCRTERFHALRVYLARQHHGVEDPAGSGGNVVAIRSGRLERLGRMTLFGFGNLATTSYHVIFREEDAAYWGEKTQRLFDPVRGREVETKASDDGKLYFESHLYRGLSKLIEIDLGSFRPDCAYVEDRPSLQCDGVQVRLRQDVTRRFARDPDVHAVLWDYRVDHDAFHEAAGRLTFVRSSRRVYPFVECESVAPHHPRLIRSGFSLSGVFFHGCPTRNNDSGAQVLFTDGENVNHVWGFHLAKVLRVRVGEDSGKRHLKLGIALTPSRIDVMNDMYFAEMRRRHIEPSDPATWPEF